MRPVVALLSDFGTQDYYVGAMKGAVLAAAPDAQLVDIAHELPPHDVRAGALALEGAYTAFPAGAVFLAVVDPGVGSARRAMALEAGGYRFVGPDNGLFSLILARHPDSVAHEITNAGLFRHEVSSTFHGRDVFAPVAGRLAQGMPVTEVGPRFADPVVFALAEAQAVGDSVWEAPVLHVDGFGNLVTAFTARDVASILAGSGGDPNGIVVVVESVVMPFVRAYADVAAGQPCALLGSGGRLEVAVHRGAAGRVLGAAPGTPVRVRRL
jgi:S-adenosyl-L-methionine hydrolase (adenosine-forming)